MYSKLVISTFFTLFFIFLSGNAVAQLDGDRYDKLFDLYILEDYEKCIRKAERYTRREKTEDDPEPYLYLSKCYLAISKDRELSEFYPRALKNALKYAYKLHREDEETDVMERNMDYILELERAAIEEAMYEYNLEDYRKGAYYLKKILKFDPNNEYVRLMCGVAQVQARNRRTGKDNINAALDSLKLEYEAVGELDGEFAYLVPEALLDYTKYLIDKNMIGKAESIISKARLYAVNNKEVEKMYNRLYGDG